ncbi:MAG: glycosyltransferase family 39 protein, partial [Bacilli bacterium]|nr:glycosyltransferase family 39 protein [Bacilli bacterium]
MKKLKELWKNKPEIILFIGSFLFLVLIGLMISYNYEIKDNYNLLFDSDTARVIKDATEIGGEHYRVSVHPLFILFVQPICFLLSGITLNKMIAIILLSSFVSSLSVVFLYKILNRIQKNQNLSLIISLIYLFSFSNIIFTAGIETYNFASLFLILLWYYFILKEKELDKTSYILLVLLGITSFAFTITNIIIFGIILLLLLMNKKITLKNAILVGITVILSVFVLNIGQKLIWNNTPFFWITNVSEETTNFGNNNISLHNIKNVIENDYSNSLISPSIGLKVKYGSTFNGQNYIISFQKMNVIGILFLVVFYGLLAMVLIRNFMKNKYLNIGLLLALAFNTCLHIIYGNDGTFLYSLHFLYLIILLLGINLGKEENEIIKKYGNIFLIVFLIVELINNNIIVYQTIKLIKDNIKANYLMTHLGTIPTILLEIGIIIVIGLIIYFIRKLILLNKKEKNKEMK